jgi:hypothetical protein
VPTIVTPAPEAPVPGQTQPANDPELAPATPAELQNLNQPDQPDGENMDLAPSNVELDTQREPTQD